MTYVIEKFQFCLYNRAMQAPTHNFSHPRWTWMTSLGWIVGLIVAILAGDLVGDSDFVFTYFGGITALFVGLMQWLVIRKFAITPQWIWLTVLGWVRDSSWLKEYCGSSLRHWTFISNRMKHSFLCHWNQRSADWPADGFNQSISSRESPRPQAGPLRNAWVGLHLLP